MLVSQLFLNIYALPCRELKKTANLLLLLQPGHLITTHNPTRF